MSKGKEEERRRGGMDNDGNKGKEEGRRRSRKANQGAQEVSLSAGRAGRHYRGV